MQTHPTLLFRRPISARLQASTRNAMVALALLIGIWSTQVTVTATKKNPSDDVPSFTNGADQPTPTPASGCSVPSFAAATNFGAGTGPKSVTTGDFNADGKLDLATANSQSDNVSVLLGNGTGGFAGAANFGTGDFPESVTTGDFNSDGKLDLATANAFSSNVSVLLGDGMGGFAPAVNFGVGSSPQSVTTGDFNADGKLDLATANASGNVSVLLGDGMGGFAPAVNFGSGSIPFSVTTGDFNADGKLDLATANISDNVSVLLGNGLGGFAPAANFSAGNRPVSVTTGDFNADGKLDLVTANQDSDNVSVLLGNGTGSFAPAMNFGAGNGPVSVTTGDFNADGKLDLATANQDFNNVSVLLGNGMGGFAPAVNFAGLDPVSVTTGDFNADGKLDLVSANDITFGNVSVLLNTCTAQTTTPTATPTSTPTPSITPTVTPGPSVTATPTPTGPAQAQNLSTRLNAGTGDNVGIGGFIITGTEPKQVLVRGIGPSLGGAGVPNPLADPVLELHSGGAPVINNNWRDTQEKQIEATGIAPSNDLESAILTTLAPGAYTVILKGNNDVTGAALVEIYDLSSGSVSKMGNISTRAFVGTGDDIVIGGFILGVGPENALIIVRGIGPSLPGANVLADPTLELRNSEGAVVESNNNWQDDPDQAAIISAAGLEPGNTAEAGIAASLAPGAYTALLAGANNTTGLGLVEVYANPVAGP